MRTDIGCRSGKLGGGFLKAVLLLSALLTSPIIDAEDLILCMPNFGPDYDCGGRPRTPEEKAEYLRKEQERERAAAKRAAAKAERQAKIDAEIQRLGAHRAEEARRLVEMRERAEAAKPPKYQPPSLEPRDCPTEWVKGKAGGAERKDQAQASQVAHGDARRTCAGLGGYSASNEHCQKRERSEIVVVDGKLVRHELPPMWRCSVDYQCTNQRKACKSVPGAGIKQ